MSGREGELLELELAFWEVRLSVYLLVTSELRDRSNSLNWAGRVVLVGGVGFEVNSFKLIHLRPLNFDTSTFLLPLPLLLGNRKIRSSMSVLLRYFRKSQAFFFSLLRHLSLLPIGLLLCRMMI